MKTHAKDLGQVLSDRGWITDDALERTRARHQRLGGDFSTAILESGTVSEAHVLQALGEVHGLPTADGDDLEEIPSDVIGLLGPRDAVRFRVVPFAATASRIDVATDRPDNLKELDELSFILGKRLAVHVATEVRLGEALKGYYGYSMPTRLLSLLERMERGFLTDGDDGPAAAGATHRTQGEGMPAAPPAAGSTGRPLHARRPDEARPKATTSRFRPLSPQVAPDPKRSIPLTDAERQALQTGISTDDGSRHPSLLEAMARLELASSASQIADSLIDGLEPWLEHLVVLRGSAGELVGWKTKEAREDTLRLFRVNGSEPSVFADLLEGGPLYTGGLVSNEAHDRLAACWEGDLTGTFTVLPVRLGNRPVCVVLGRAKDPESPTVPPEALRRLREAAERAFEALLDDRRK
ncbi:MAG: hypothetical protein R2991_05380 [Thermoanaerobaculia bacterium]